MNELPRCKDNIYTGVFGVFLIFCFSSIPILAGLYLLFM